MWISKVHSLQQTLQILYINIYLWQFLNLFPFWRRENEKEQATIGFVSEIHKWAKREFANIRRHKNWNFCA